MIGVKAGILLALNYLYTHVGELSVRVMAVGETSLKPENRFMLRMRTSIWKNRFFRYTPTGLYGSTAMVTAWTQLVCLYCSPESLDKALGFEADLQSWNLKEIINFAMKSSKRPEPEATRQDTKKMKTEITISQPILKGKELSKVCANSYWRKLAHLELRLFAAFPFT